MQLHNTNPTAPPIWLAQRPYNKTYIPTTLGLTTIRHLSNAEMFDSWLTKYKRGNDLQKENYRPVCTLIAISKIFERSMSDQLGTYFENIFSKFLSAFRRKYGCQSALVRMCEEWRMSLDKGESVRSIAMDLSRAFDSVPHGLLIAKFHAYGASTTAC